MVVPVVIGKSSFDFRPLRAEQARLSKTLVVPSPRDKDDTSQILEVVDDQATPFKYPTFIKVFYDRTNDFPRFELWMKDNFDNEHNLTTDQAAAFTTTTPLIPINDNPLTGIADPNGNVTRNFAISPITGEIMQGAYFDDILRTFVDENGITANGVDTADGSTGNAFSGIHRGSIKFDGVTGLALAAINNRIADVSNAVEGVTKVLQVVGGNLDGVINLIR